MKSSILADADVPVCHILDISEHASMKDILITLSKAEEFGTHRFRGTEKSFYNELKKNQALRFSYTERTTEIWQKVMLLAQLDISSIDLNHLVDKHKDSLNNVAIHKSSIRLQLMRLLSCTIDCLLEKDDAIAVSNAIELRRSVAAKCWENQPSMLKQLPGIGDGSLRTLLGAGIDSFSRLEKSDPRELERIFKRNPPFGNNLLKDLASLPRLSLVVHEIRTIRAKDNVKIVFKVHLNCANKPRTKKNGCPHFIIFLAYTNEGHLLDFRRQLITKIMGGKEFSIQANLRQFSSGIVCQLSCEEVGMHCPTGKSPLMYHIVNSIIECSHDLDLKPEDFPSKAAHVSGFQIKEQLPVPVQHDSKQDRDQNNEYLDIFDGQKIFGLQ